ncbi:MAG: hypothetical protein ABR548_00410 [Actinomycetota bacterium]|nr:hypothetical protein [Actinomycetota bacterium]
MKLGGVFSIGRARLLLAICLMLASLGTATASSALGTPPVATISISGALSATQKVVFDKDVLGVSSDNTRIRFMDDATPVSASIRCWNGSSAAVGCTSGPVRSVTIKTVAPLIAGQSYTVIVNPDGVTPVVDMQGNAAAATLRSFRASVNEQETSAGATYLWRRVNDSAALGGSYRTERDAGTRAVFRFSGTQVTWYTRLGPAEGRAAVVIDGVSRVVNNYHSTIVMQYRRLFTGLSGGAHVLVVVVRGEKGSTAATGQWVAIDAMRLGSGPLQEPVYQWRPVSAGGASGGAITRTSTPGSRVQFPFRGAGIDWFTITGPSEGLVNMYIDGRLIKTVDNYSASTHYGVRRTIIGMSDTVHTLSLIVMGKRNRASKANSIAVDRWVLRADTAAFRKLATWVDLYDYTSSTAESTIQSRVADMKARGVRTIFLQTGRYNTAAFSNPTQVAQWLTHAHAAGLRVVGWYLPAYSEYLSGDIAKTAVIASYVSPTGHRFDGLAIDIEYRAKTSSKTEFFNGITSQLAGVRGRVGLVYPVGAITFAPLDMDLWTAGWDGFPWASVGKYANAVMPMGYWSNRDSRCSGGDTAYCPYQYTLTNIQRSRSYTGLPVHDIGGVGHQVTASEVSKYVQAEKAGRAYGGSLYDYGVTATSFWAYLDDLNAL